MYNLPVIILDLPEINGLSWCLLSKGSCSVYGKSMGHCGNVNYKLHDLIYSLFDSKTKIHYLSFIVNNKVLKQAKGRNSEKPDEKFIPNIIQLLKTDLIEEIKDSKYRPENNFKFCDLSEEIQQEILKIHPKLAI